MEIEIEKLSSNVHQIDITEDIRAGWTKKMLFMSDVHIDSTKCDRELLRKHLKQAKEDRALIFIIGDLFDIMQGRNDRRSAKIALDADILKRMQEEDLSYYDAACAFAIEFFEPFKDNLAFVSYGNHETAINRHNEFNILQRFTTELDCALGAYEGYIKVRYIGTGRGVNKVFKYHHGYGGAKRSKGMLDSQLFGYMYPSADVCVRGHNHFKFQDTNIAEVLTQSGRLLHRKQYYINLGSYKKKDPGMGWEVEKGFFPTALGGWWIENVCFSNKDGNYGNGSTRDIRLKVYEAD